MYSIIRFVVSVVTFTGTVLFSFWFVFAQIIPSQIPVLATALSLASGVYASRFVWRIMGNTPDRLGRAVAYGAVVTGSFGFIGGFLGPMIFATDTQQGPLIGAFVVGPLGGILGAIAGAIWWSCIRKHKKEPLSV